MRLFDGWQLVDPGLVPKHAWRPDCDGPAPTSGLAYGGVARRP
jgi:hypothetical protein